MSVESPRKMQDEQEVMSETPGISTRGRRVEAVETKVFRNGWKASPDTLMVKVTMSGSR